MLFFCMWDEVPGRGRLNSLIVDATDVDGAMRIATDVAEAEAPSRVLPIPPDVFAVEVAWETDDDDDDDEFLTLQPLEHVAALIDRFEERSEDVPAISAACGDEADAADGEAVTCGLVVGHAGDHAATTSAGQRVTWES